MPAEDRPGELLQDVILETGERVGVEVAGDAAVVHPLAGLDLPPEAGPELGVLGQLGPDHLPVAFEVGDVDAVAAEAERLGFRVEAEEAHYFGPGERRWRMAQEGLNQLLGTRRVVALHAHAPLPQRHDEPAQSPLVRQPAIAFCAAPSMALPPTPALTKPSCWKRGAMPASVFSESVTFGDRRSPC